jgi:hypothetical protein
VSQREVKSRPRQHKIRTHNPGQAFIRIVEGASFFKSGICWMSDAIAFRGSQTTSRLTSGFRGWFSRGGDVPSSKIRDRARCSPPMNSTIGRLDLQQAFHNQLALPIHHRRRDGLVHVHAEILFLTRKGRSLSLAWRREQSRPTPKMGTSLCCMKLIP